MPQLKAIQPNQRPRKPKKKKKKAMPASHRDAPVTRYLDDDDYKAGGSGDVVAVLRVEIVIMMVDFGFKKDS